MIIFLRHRWSCKSKGEDTAWRRVWLYQMTLKKTVILHPDAVQRVYAARPEVRGSTLWYYHGSLVYDDLSAGDSHVKAYGKSVTQVKRATFVKWANRRQEMAEDRTMVQHAMWVIPSTSCAMRNVGDGRYLPADEVQESKKIRKK